MNASVRIGRVFGIQIGIHYSWFFIFLLAVWSLATAYFPERHPGWSTQAYWGMAVLASLLLFASVLAHELGHSLVAIRRGIPVRSITLFLFGGAAHIERESETPAGELFMSAAGPVISFALAGLFALLYLWLREVNVHLGEICIYLALANTMLGAFNLIPGFPLDGGRIFRAVLWGLGMSFRRATCVSSLTGQMVATLFIVAGILAAFLVGWLGGLWLAFVGWFLANAAGSAYKQTVVMELLREARVDQVMLWDFQTIPPDLTLHQALYEHIIPRGQRALPVVQSSEFVGLITLTDVKKVPQEHWNAMSVRQVMIPADRVVTARPGDDLAVALQRLQEKDLNQLIVLDGGKLVGMVTRGSLLNYLQLRQELEGAR